MKKKIKLKKPFLIAEIGINHNGSISLAKKLIDQAKDLGFEPEILNGSKDVLNRIEYIGVDGSSERGPKAETTIDYAIKFLTENNFKMIGSNIYNHHAKALFKNQNFKNL